MKFSCLTSGSAGNSAFIGTESTRILIDAGLSAKMLVARLASIGETIDGLDGILISHAHIDHVSGLEVILGAAMKRGRSIPIYVTRETASRLKWKRIESPPLRYFEAGSKIEIGDMQAQSFTTPHDCIDSVAFTVSAGGVKIGLATDLGFIPDAMPHYFRGCSLVAIESNYDSDMLRDGDYPLHLKQRISSDVGHLPNSATRNFIRRNMDVSVRHLILCHLSRENNLPSLAREGAGECIASRGLGTNLVLATYEKATEAINL